MRKAVEMNAVHRPFVVIQMPPALSQVTKINEVLVVVAVTIASGILSIIMSARETREFEGQGHFQWVSMPKSMDPPQAIWSLN